MTNQVITKDIKDVALDKTPLGGQARMLVNNPHLRLVNLQIKAGEQVLAHTAPVEVVFIVLAGSGLVQIEEKVYPISAGQMLICPPDCQRSIQAGPEEDLSLLVVRTPNL